jgi:hypothetical protein
MSQRKQSNRGIFLTVLLFIAAAVAYFLFWAGSEFGTPIQSEALEIPFRKQGELFFTGRQSGDTLAVIDVEVADNNQLRARGLMYRRFLPENAGMLFIQSREETQSFWMKNT